MKVQMATLTRLTSPVPPLSPSTAPARSDMPMMDDPLPLTTGPTGRRMILDSRTVGSNQHEKHDVAPREVTAIKHQMAQDARPRIKSRLIPRSMRGSAALEDISTSRGPAGEILHAMMASPAGISAAITPSHHITVTFRGTRWCEGVWAARLQGYR